MALWNEPSRKEPVSKDSPAAEPTRETERPLAAVPPAATPAVNRGGLTAAVLSFMVVLATAGTATVAQISGPADGGSTGLVDTMKLSLRLSVPRAMFDPLGFARDLEAHRGLQQIANQLHQSALAQDTHAPRGKRPNRPRD